MPFVEWHYRNGYYVRSHYRRLPWRRADTCTPPLFALSGPAGTLRRGRGGSREPATPADDRPDTPARTAILRFG
jgi:hypothetical protein